MVKDMKDVKRVLSFDAETNGLWGQAFAIGAILYNEDGTEADRFIGRCPIEGAVDDWVRDNVLPQVASIPETHRSYEGLLRAFFAWRAPLKVAGVQELVHMGCPVEAKLYLDAHKLGIIGDWDGPYPLLDCSAIPEIGDSVDSYNEKNGISPDPAEFAGGTHNPLYDSAAAYVAYGHSMGWDTLKDEVLNHRGFGTSDVSSLSGSTDQERRQREQTMLRGCLG